jgi:hypothetical protein
VPLRARRSYLANAPQPVINEIAERPVIPARRIVRTDERPRQHAERVEDMAAMFDRLGEATWVNRVKAKANR